MRVLSERLKGRDVDLLDGIKIFEENGWAQVLPDPDEPLVHVYAEGATDADAARIEAEYLGLVEGIIAADPDGGTPSS
jgi:mannose-1-phosphate guanylyltransferase/phosphomannomutase